MPKSEANASPATVDPQSSFGRVVAALLVAVGIGAGGDIFRAVEAHGVHGNGGRAGGDRDGFLATLRAAVVRFAQDEGRFPESLPSLVPRYLAELPRDPYGRDYVLNLNGSRQAWIASRGADGELRRYPPDMQTVVDLDDARAP